MSHRPDVVAHTSCPLRHCTTRIVQSKIIVSSVSSYPCRPRRNTPGLAAATPANAERSRLAYHLVKSAVTSSAKASPQRIWQSASSARPVQVWMQIRLAAHTGSVTQRASGSWHFCSRHFPMAAPSVAAMAGDGATAVLPNTRRPHTALLITCAPVLLIASSGPRGVDGTRIAGGSKKHSSSGPLPVAPIEYGCHSVDLVTSIGGDSSISSTFSSPSPGRKYPRWFCHGINEESPIDELWSPQ